MTGREGVLAAEECCVSDNSLCSLSSLSLLASSTSTLPSEVPGIMVGSDSVMVDVTRTIRILIPNLSTCNTHGPQSMGLTDHSAGVDSSGMLSAFHIKLFPQLLFALLTQALVTKICGQDWLVAT